MAKKKKKTEKKTVAALPPVPKRIRVLFSGANKDRCYLAGRSYRVPEEVPEDSARAWLASGKAEEDKIPPGPSETKVIEPEETKDEESEVKEEPAEEDKSGEGPAEIK